MKKMMKLSFAVFFLSTTFAFASDYDLCICQTGSAPSNQIGFFKVGCTQWNATQRCDKKIIVDQAESLEKIIGAMPEVKTVKLGYVGHWGSSRQTVEFLNEQVVPAIKEHKVSFNIDNTACLATNNPFVIKNYLSELDKEIASNIFFRGNQVVSTGGWDSFLPQKTNLWSTISGETQEVTFPSCQSFAGRACIGAFQEKAHGICFDREKNRHQFLVCLGKKADSKPISHHEWKLTDLEIKVQERETGKIRSVIGVAGNDSLDRVVETYGSLSTYDLTRYQRELEGRGLKKITVIIKKNPEVLKIFSAVAMISGLTILNKDFQTNEEREEFMGKVIEDVSLLLIEKAK